MMILDTLMAPLAGLPAFRPRNSESSDLKNPRQWFIDWVRSGSSDAGVSITGESSLTYSTIWQAVTVLSGDVGQLPLNVYRRSGEDDLDKETDRKHPAFTLVRHRPNPYTSWQDFAETMMVYALLWGNGVAEIAWDNRGRPIQLTPLLPDRTWLDIESGVPWYVTRQGKNREETASYRKLRPEDVLHIRGLSWNGLWGIDVISKARNSWGLGLGQEKYANKFFSNHAMPTGTLEYPGRFRDEETIKRIRADWRNLHEGLDNVGRVAVLEEGMKFNAMSFNNRDSQWLEGRKFQRGEIASWFNLPPHKVGDLERATFTNIEEQNRAYLQTSLMRWLIKWQEECREKLLTARERREDTHFFEFNVAALLRGDIKSRYDAYTVGLGGAPFLTQNEVRRMESMPGVDGGDQIRNPLNMDDPGGADNEEKPKQAGSSGGSDAGGDGKTAQNAAKEAFRGQLRYLADVEAKRIRHEARDPRRITGWMEKFYGAGQWPAKLREGLVPWGQADRADAWCRRSLEILDQVVGTATDRELEAEIETVLREWPARVDAMVQEVFG